MKKFNEMVYYPKRKNPIKLFEDEHEDYKIIAYNLGTHPVCYVGIPLDSLIVGFDYSDLRFIKVHGGLTYSAKGDGNYLPKGYWWYGWDYAHSGDYMGYYDDKDNKKWTTQEIHSEALFVAYDLKYLENFLRKFIYKKISRRFYDV